MSIITKKFELFKNIIKLSDLFVFGRKIEKKKFEF